MPKDRRRRSADRSSPFPSHSSASRRKSSVSSSSRNLPISPRPEATNVQEWDEIRCPVCIEHPHNAVLLLCASHDRGCRPFLCDTSYRHSNCLDQYRKATDASMPDDSKRSLFCPLCRGVVSGWKVVDPARKHMNIKVRSCSMDSCGYAGVYSDLRKHARTEHPLIRPSDTDPERERDWRRMQLQQDLGDLLSTMQPVLMDQDDDFTILSDGGEFGSFLPFPTITLFLVLRFRGAGGLNARRRSFNSSRYRRGRARVLWGESITESQTVERGQSDADNGGEVEGHDDEEEEDNENDGGGEEISAVPSQDSLE